MEMLTLTEKLALLGERINAPALTDIILRSLHFFDATIYLILFIVCSSWDVLEKKRPGFYIQVSLSCILNISRAIICVEVENKFLLNTCIWIFEFRIICKLLSFEFRKKSNWLSYLTVVSTDSFSLIILVGKLSDKLLHN